MAAVRRTYAARTLGLIKTRIAGRQRFQTKMGKSDLGMQEMMCGGWVGRKVQGARCKVQITVHASRGSA